MFDLTHAHTLTDPYMLRLSSHPRVAPAEGPANALENFLHVYWRKLNQRKHAEALALFITLACAEERPCRFPTIAMRYDSIVR